MVATLRGSAARQVMHRQTQRGSALLPVCEPPCAAVAVGAGVHRRGDLGDLPAGVGVHPVELLKLDPATWADSLVPVASTRRK